MAQVATRPKWGPRVPGTTTARTHEAATKARTGPREAAPSRATTSDATIQTLICVALEVDPLAIWQIVDRLHVIGKPRIQTALAVLIARRAVKKIGENARRRRYALAAWEPPTTVDPAPGGAVPGNGLRTAITTSAKRLQAERVPTAGGSFWVGRPPEGFTRLCESRIYTMNASHESDVVTGTTDGACVERD